MYSPLKCDVTRKVGSNLYSSHRKRILNLEKVHNHCRFDLSMRYDYISQSSFIENIMKTFYIKILAIYITTFVFWGCPTTPPKAEKEITKPEITLQIASLNLTNLNKRIEQKDINQLTKILKREQVEILAVQNISRYPGVSTRVDLVNELTAQTDMRSAFGEMLNSSGRQIGNAVFSSYPILSHFNQSFDNVKSANYEAALATTIDAGVASVIIISAQFPSKASSDDQAQCIKLISALNPNSNKPLMVVAGNLPTAAREDGSFKEIQISNERSASNQLWYTSAGALEVLNSRTIHTDLGTMVIARLGLFRQK
jgi:endonuclease/exonuclease/phosphatase family metal-dependent hydrolase